MEEMGKLFCNHNHPGVEESYWQSPDSPHLDSLAFKEP